MSKEKVQNKVQAIQWTTKKYKIMYRQSNGQTKKYKIKYKRSNGQRKRTKQSTGNPMTKEKVQNKVQTIQWLKKKYKIKYRQSND